MAHLPIPIQGYSCALGESEGEYCVYKGQSHSERISTIAATIQIPQFLLKPSSQSGVKHLHSLFPTPRDQCQNRSRINLQMRQRFQVPRSEVLCEEYVAY